MEGEVEPDKEGEEEDDTANDQLIVDERQPDELTDTLVVEESEAQGQGHGEGEEVNDTVPVSLPNNEAGSKVLPLLEGLGKVLCVKDPLPEGHELTVRLPELHSVGVED